MMKKSICAVIFILCLLAALPVTATESRVGSMGGVGYYVRDNSNIFYFPGTIVQYSNQAVAEMREKKNDDLYSVGFHMEALPGKVLGAYLNRPLNLPDDISDVAPSLSLDRCTSVLLGGKASAFDYGVMLSIAMDSKDQDATKTKESAYYFGINAGISTDVSDLGLVFELPSVKKEVMSSETTWGGFGMGLKGRYFSQRTTEMELVLLGTFYYGSAKKEATLSEIDYSKLQLGLGIGVNYEVNRNNMLVLAVEALGLNQDKDAIKNGTETTETTFTFPGIYLGVESQVKSWLITRLGARQVYESFKDSTKPYVGSESSTTTYRSDFDVVFGLGIVMGRLHLDTIFDEGILFDGPNFISGQINTMANRISLTYYFDHKGE